MVILIEVRFAVYILYKRLKINLSLNQPAIHSTDIHACIYLGYPPYNIETIWRKLITKYTFLQFLY